MKIKILSLEAIMMASWVNWGSNETWNHISNSCFFQPWYKSCGQFTIWRAILIFKMGCFWSNLHYIAHSSTRGFWTLTRAHGLMKGQGWLKLMLIVIYGKRNLNHVKKKNWIWPFPRVVSAHNARGDLYGRKILKCLKWPDSYSRLIVKWFWAF